MRRTADPRAGLADALAGLGLSASLIPPLQAYLGEMARWNRAYNLTAIRDPDEMVTRHVLDSLAILPAIGPYVPAGARLLDVGSGAGLPGIPLAIARPSWRVAVLDSNGKKARFMRHAVRTLRLANVEVIEARAESLSLPARAEEGNASGREGPLPYDAIVSRAFASLADFVTATSNALASSGRWLAMKGKLDPAELAALPPDVVVEATLPVTVPGLREDRHVVVMRRPLLPDPATR